MTTIQLQKETKDRLESVAKSRDLSINKFVRELLDNAESPDTVKDKPAQEYANIQIDDDLRDKLKSYRLHNRESYTDIISRLLDDSDFD